MRTDEEYKAIVDNFEEFANKINDFQKEIETSSNTAESLSKSTYPSNKTGFGHWIQGDLEYWRNKYGEAVVGAAIEEIEAAFPELSDPHFFYWTTNEDVQEEIEIFVELYEMAFEEAADKIRNNLERIKQEQEEERRREEEERRRKEEAENRRRAREQAERAREIENKYSTPEIGKTETSGFFKNLGSKIRGFFRRG